MCRNWPRVSTGLVLFGAVLVSLVAACTGAPPQQAGTGTSGQQLFTMALRNDDEALDRGVLSYTALTEINVRQSTTFAVEVTDTGRGTATGAYVSEVDGMIVDPQDVPTNAQVGVTAQCFGSVTCTPRSGRPEQTIINVGQSGSWSWNVSAVSPGRAQIVLTATTYDTATNIDLHTTAVTVNVAVHSTFAYTVDSGFDEAKTLILAAAAAVAVIAGAISAMLALRRTKKKKKRKSTKSAAGPGGTPSPGPGTVSAAMEPAGASVMQSAQPRPPRNPRPLWWIGIVVGALIVAISADTSSPALGLRTFAVLAVATVIYYVPTITGYVRRRPDLAQLAGFNVVLGWTVVGWIIAFVWSLRTPEPSRVNRPLAYPSYTASVVTEPSSPSASQPMAASQEIAASQERAAIPWQAPPMAIPPAIPAQLARSDVPPRTLALWQTPDVGVTWQEPAGEWTFRWCYRVSLGQDSRPRFVLVEEAQRFFPESGPDADRDHHPIGEADGQA
jgi:hypothetical protein